MPIAINLWARPNCAHPKPIEGVLLYSFLWSWKWGGGDVPIHVRFMLISVFYSLARNIICGFLGGEQCCIQSAFTRGRFCAERTRAILDDSIPRKLLVLFNFPREFRSVWFIVIILLILARACLLDCGASEMNGFRWISTRPIVTLYSITSWYLCTLFGWFVQ